MSAQKRKADSALEAGAAPTTKRPAFASAANIPTMKQEADANGTAASASSASSASIKQESIKQEDGGVKQEEDDEAFFYKPSSHLDGLQRDSNGHIICPYLDTINRRALDFDFEKQCSITLSPLNVYACLVCGRYFQGRGKNSQAYAHSLDQELAHHVFINLQTEEIWCLPDGYQVFDASLEDIKFNLHPKFKDTDLEKLDRQKSFIHALDGTDYLPGLLGLNNIQHTDWLNVLVQAMNFIKPWRNFFLRGQHKVAARKVIKQGKIMGAKQNGSAGATAAASAAASAASASSATAASSTAVIPAKSDLAEKYAELLAKLWNPRSFKGHVSPHELLQSLSILSMKKFRIGHFSDALLVLSWMLNHLHRELGGGKKMGSSIVHQTFQGEIKITTETPIEEGEDEGKEGEGKKEDGVEKMDTEEDDEKEADSSKPKVRTTVEHRPFLYLSLALPPAPLFKDSTDRAIIPQVPLFDLLKKFDGHTWETSVDPVTKKEVRRSYTITKLPPYLIVHYQRFKQNGWFWEKNPTLVTFPLQNLDMKPYVTEEAPATNEDRSEEAVRKLGVAELKKRLAARKVSAQNVVEKEELIRLLLQSYSSSSSVGPSTRYNLLSNIVHEGQPGASSKDLSGSYKCHTHHQATDTWYATEDLHVWTTETMPQLVALSEAYIQVYERVE